MIRMGRYDALDKWEIICRAWAGEVIDVGHNRIGNPSLPEWQSSAIHGGWRHCDQYIRLKCAGLEAGTAGHVDLDAELQRLLGDIDQVEILARVRRFINLMGSPSGLNTPFSELPSRLTDRLREIFRLGALTWLRYTEEIGEIPDIDTVRLKKRTFPVRAIKGKRNVLDLFCALQYGIHDVIHVHDICPDHVTLVDSNANSLDDIRQINPPEWTYVKADYKAALREAAESGSTWDLIVADPPLALCPEVAFEMLPMIMARCTDMFVCHYGRGMFEELGVSQDDFTGLSRAIGRRTGVDVVVTDREDRSRFNCFLVMRKAT